MRGQKPAFTLAEVLITLAVIGIVAALTIGVFLPKIHEKIRASQIATAEVKFTKAMEQMALNNAIGPYYDTTQEFVDELQNYLKISKVCANDKLEECFGYDKIKLDNGKELKINEIKNGSSFGIVKNDDNNYGETVGIITIDGTGMILSWNKNCPILEPKVYPWNGNTNETTSCVTGIMDINLDKSPNTKNKDIALFRADKLGEACGIEFTYNGTRYCWSAPFNPTSLTYEQCESEKENLGIQNCCPVSTCNNHDYWAGAVKKCGNISNMPNATALKALAQYIYQVKDINSILYTYELNLNRELLANVSPELSINKSFIIWGPEFSSNNGYYRRFSTDYTDYNGSNRHNSHYAVCVIK